VAGSHVGCMSTHTITLCGFRVLHLIVRTHQPATLIARVPSTRYHDTRLFPQPATQDKSNAQSHVTPPWLGFAEYAPIPVCHVCARDWASDHASSATFWNCAALLSSPRANRLWPFKILFCSLYPVLRMCFVHIIFDSSNLSGIHRSPSMWI
jgi:hypothetical protein